MRKKKLNGINKIREFWKHNINPITGWKKTKGPKQSIVEDPTIREKDQASLFRPKGFR